MLHYNITFLTLAASSMRPRHTSVTAGCVAVCSLVFSAWADAAPRVVASITPVHSLVAGVMQDVGQPVLLVRGYGSPHAYQLRPSDAVTLSEADIVFRIGESLETFLQKPLSTLGNRTLVIDLMESEGLNLLHNRKSGVWMTPHHEEARKADGHGHSKDEHHHGEIDPHIWLDPDNAKRIVDKIVGSLSHMDPVNATTYASNGTKLAQRIDAMDRAARRKLAPVQDVPYAVFHDAHQYLEKHYHLNAVGSITVSPNRLPSARRLRELRSTIRAVQARCVFSEPQFNSALIETITEGTEVNRGVLDPLGAAFEPGPNAYFEMMSANVSAIIGCLSK